MTEFVKLYCPNCGTFVADVPKGHPLTMHFHRREYSCAHCGRSFDYKEAEIKSPQEVAADQGISSDIFRQFDSMLDTTTWEHTDFIFNVLLNQLSTNEKVEAAIRAFVPGQTRLGALCITNRRLLYVGRVHRYGMQDYTLDFRYPIIASVSHKSPTLIPEGTLSIAVAGQDPVIFYCLRVTKYKEFAVAIREIILQTPSDEGAGNKSGNIVSELERLASLYQQGVLTSSEFEEAKKRLLG